jgi:hypothetical protein
MKNQLIWQVAAPRVCHPIPEQPAFTLIELLGVVDMYGSRAQVRMGNQESLWS